MTAVVFVCLGNICRSPLAEAILGGLVATRRDVARWRIDSAGTGDWHVGSRADPRTLATCARHGLVSTHRARQVAVDDFRRFDRVFAMDARNLADLERLRPEDGVAPTLLGALDPQAVREVPDPYHGGEADFEAVFRQLRRCCAAFAASVPDEG